MAQGFTFQRESQVKNSMNFKIIAICILILFLLIPTNMVKKLMHEREIRQSDVVSEINSKWGESQTITGPILTIPYVTRYLDDEGIERLKTFNLHVLPEKLQFMADIEPSTRYRGIYEAVLYESQMLISGYFSLPELNELNINLTDLMLERSSISLGLSDLRGINDQITASFSGASVTMNPGIDTRQVISHGISSNVQISDWDQELTFDMTLNFRGSQSLQFIPVGKVTDVELKSTWPSPSFIGSYLPKQHTITDSGFNAKWKVLHLNRTFPQWWTDSRYTVKNSEFGLKLFIPADIYQQSMRTVKYAILFIAFTILAFFFSEISLKKRIHPIQYLLIGIAVVMFYTLLISISEHLNFTYAYLISSLSVIVLISAYSLGIMKNKKFTGSVCGTLVVLYSYMFVILKLEDYSLIMGSIGLFFVLAAVMYFTRDIDWYEVQNIDKREEKIDPGT